MFTVKLEYLRENNCLLQILKLMKVFFIFQSSTLYKSTPTPQHMVLYYKYDVPGLTIDMSAKRNENDAL